MNSNCSCLRPVNVLLLAVCVGSMAAHVSADVGARGKIRTSASTVQLAPGRMEPAVASGGRDGGGQSVPTVTARKSSSGARVLRVVGRFVYIPILDFGGGEINGVDTILVEVRDDDTIGHSVLWSGYTDDDGYFDTGILDISDDDNEPDLYVYFETNSPYVSVEDGDIISANYSWDSFDSLLVDDFTGEFFDFGTHTPAETGVGSSIPALNVFQTLNRARRFVLQVTNLNVSKVDVLWPSGDDFGYDYDGEMSLGEFIYSDSQILHLYAHHLERDVGMVVPASNDCSNDCQYCKTGGAACANIEDCPWCPMTRGVARSEGFADWFPAAAARAFRAGYTFDSGKPIRIGVVASNEFFPPESVPDDPFDDVLDLSEIRAYCGADAVDNADRVIGAVAAMLEDLADITMDDHAGDGLSECAYLTDGTILTTYLIDKPADVLAMIDLLIVEFPNDLPSLYSAALNMSPLYTARFPADITPPGKVRSVRSSSHPVGVGGPLPCISLEWQLPVDDVTGACAYSYEWTTNPAGLEPDLIEDINATCTLTDGPFNFGQYYISMRAKDCAGHWSSDWDVSGPFEVTDCNNNTIIDICEKSCAPPVVWTGGCSVGTFCELQPNCQLGDDCNANLIPDDCDTADGTSEDCNENSVPDECENIYHWETDADFWNVGASWVEGERPVVGSDVCIDVPGDVTVRITDATVDIGVLACEETLQIIDIATPRPDVTLNEPSWIRGDLQLAGKASWLRVLDRLDVYGRLVWTGSNDSQVAALTGVGETHVYGGATLASNVPLEGHRLILEPGSSSTSTGAVWFSGGSILEIKQGATFDHQGTGRAFVGFTDDRVINDGTIIRSAATGNSDFDIPVTNNGLIHILSGEVTLPSGSTHTGRIVGDPGTIFRLTGGGHSFLASSSIVADKVEFVNGTSGSIAIRGSYNVTGPTTKNSSQTVTFTNEATIINYGLIFSIPRGTVNFDAVVGGQIHFDNLTLGSSSGGTANFNSGDSVDIDVLSIGPGTLAGPSTITVNTQFTWGASATIRGPGVIDVKGNSTVGTGGGQKTLLDRTMNNHGYMTINGGFQMNGASEFTNYPGATVDIRVDSGGAVIGGGASIPFYNNGKLLKSAGVGNSDITTPVTNAGTVEIQVGKIEFSQPFNQTAGETVLNGGGFYVWWPTQFIPSIVFDGGVLTGDGAFTSNQLAKVSNVGATVKPGLPIGTIVIEGTYTQLVGGTLEIEIGGANPGEFDRLEVSGAATLAGELIVLQDAGFTPAPGSVFVILTAGSVAGEFDTVTAPAQYVVRYKDQEVRLIVPLPGDLDVNGVANLYDWYLFAPCFNGSGNPPAVTCPPDVNADMDGDSDVDLDDASIMSAAMSND